MPPPYGMPPPGYGGHGPPPGFVPPPWAGGPNPGWGMPPTAAAPQEMCDWSEHTAPDGKKYYYNSKSVQSTWVKPKELIDFEQGQNDDEEIEDEDEEIKIPTTYREINAISKQIKQLEKLKSAGLEIIRGGE